MTSNSGECRYANGFSLWEKLWAQGSYFTMMIVGTAGIARADWHWLAPYLLIAWYGLPGIIMRYVICPRCPHLYVYNDCLQVPPGLAKWLVKERKNTPLSAAEKAVFWLVLLTIPLYPLYWLRSEPVLLTVFVASAVMWFAAQLLYFCKRCRVRECPMNRVPIAMRASAR